MIVKITRMDNWTKAEDGTYSCTRLDASDSRGTYTCKNLSADNIMYCYCSNVDTGAVNVLVLYQVISIAKATSARTTKMCFKRLTECVNDDDVPSIDNAFICSRDNYIDDIPFGATYGLSDDLTNDARTYNLTHQPKNYIEVVNVSDVVTETQTADDGTNSIIHYFTLQHTPTTDKVKVDINGVTWWEDDDVSIDRTTNRVYFDTDPDDGFDFESLQESAEKIRVYYNYCY